jgi:hypothetical protein
VIHRGDPEPDRHLEDRFSATVFLGSGLLFRRDAVQHRRVGGSLLAAVKFKNAPVPASDTVVAGPLSVRFQRLKRIKSSRKRTQRASTERPRSG